MMRLSVLALIVLLAGCHGAQRTSGPNPSPGDSSGPRSGEPRRRGGPLEAARSFVDALNTMDVERAAGLIDWNTWVAADARLKALLHALRRGAHQEPPSPQQLAAPAIEGSEVTLREILDSNEPSRLLATIARDRFAAAIREDFAPGRRQIDAKLVSWHLDRIERSATLWMPNGRQIQMLMHRRDGDWKLVPRWHP